MKTQRCDLCGRVVRGISTALETLVKHGELGDSMTRRIACAQCRKNFPELVA